MNTAHKRGFAHPITILVGVLVLAALAVGGYFFYTKTYIPTKIKEQAQKIQPVYTEYAKSTEDLGKHLVDKTNLTDEAAFSKYLEQGKTNLKTYQTNFDTLKPLVNNLSYSDTQEYKQKLNTAITKSEEVSQMEKNVEQVADIYIQTLKESQQLTKDFENIAKIDSATQFVAELKKLDTKVDAMTKSLESIKVTEPFKTYNDTMILQLKSSKEFFDNYAKAIEQKDAKGAENTITKYLTTNQELTKQLTKADADITNAIKDKVAGANATTEEVNKAYKQLQEKYNF